MRDEFGQEAPLPTVDVTDFQPEVVAGFPLPSRASVLDKGPFENLIPAYLMIFNQPGPARLAWYAVFTFPGYTDQYAVIVAADGPDGEILYCKSTMRRATARGDVFEFSPGVASRRLIDFPRPLTDYPDMPSSPISGFPADWVDVNKTAGNTTRATLNVCASALAGTLQGGVVVFDPASDTGDDQKLLNIFYFCNYMHDFLLLLGFDEASGNFQQVNFTHTGSDRDPVRLGRTAARSGTANMATGADGLPPLMNMGLVVSSGRHTAFDADVVFHEYTHGFTNRLVIGGRLNAPHSLEKLQSRGMGEGWSDYYAMTIQNFFRRQEKTVTGDWVVKNPAGIRRRDLRRHLPVQSTGPCRVPARCMTSVRSGATLMMMTRKLRPLSGTTSRATGSGCAIVTDALKVTPVEPVVPRRARRDLAGRSTTSEPQTGSRRPPTPWRDEAAWEAFAHFEMGVNATSDDADRRR